MPCDQRLTHHHDVAGLHPIIAKQRLAEKDIGHRRHGPDDRLDGTVVHELVIKISLRLRR